jgi:anti-sigma B factor antagonist
MPQATVIDLEGRITLGDATERLRDAVMKEAQTMRFLVLNMASVSYVDSAGLGQLVGCHANVSSLGGQIKLVNVQKRLRELLQMTRLCTLFEIYEDEVAALHSFAVVK